MRVYLYFGKDNEPRQTVLVQHRLSVTDTVSQVFYEGKWRRVKGSGSGRVGWYVTVDKARVPVLVSDN